MDAAGMKPFVSLLFTAVLSAGCSAPTKPALTDGAQKDLSFCDTCVRPDAPATDVVLVLVDTLRADHLGTYGYRRDTSPVIDQIAAEGTVFEQAYAHSGWTLTSTASLLTGQLPHEHRLARSSTHQDQFGKLDPNADTLASRLREKGYRTAAFINNVFLTPELGLNKGFEHYEFYGASNFEHRSAHDTVASALQWVDGLDSDEPTFLLIHLFEPHLSYIASEKTAGVFVRTTPDYPVDLTQETRDGVFPPPALASALVAGTYQPTPAQKSHLEALYDEEVLLVDHAVAALREGLQARERWDNTLFMLTSDHGEEFWDHNAFEHGHTLFGELVRVPLILRGPAVPVRRVSAPSRGVDVYQTGIAAAGISDRPSVRGRDLRLGADLPTDVSVVHENTLYGPQKAAITREGYRFLIDMSSGQGSLWAVDPTGQADVFVDDPKKREHIGRGLFDELRALRGDLKPFTVETSSTALSADAIQKLISLGYVE